MNDGEGEPMDIDCDENTSEKHQPTASPWNEKCEKNTSENHRPTASSLGDAKFEENTSENHQPTASPGNAKKEDEVQVELSVQWSGNETTKYKLDLQKLLQKWFNNSGSGDCSVLRASKHDALIHIPASALEKFKAISGQTLTKHGMKTQVQLLSIKQKQTPSVDFHPTSDLQDEKEPLEREGQTVSSSTADSEAGEETLTCSVAVPHFWYVNHIYKEELNRIERKNGVKFAADAAVKFKPNRGNGDEAKALAEFTNLVQSSIPESSSFVIPLKDMAPENISQILKIIQNSDNKILLTLTSKEMMAFGPNQKLDAIRSLNATWKTSTKTTRASNSIEMDIKDPLINGLTFDKSHWKSMKTSLNEPIAKIKARFDVDFIESTDTQGKVSVRVCSKFDENISLESHGSRALLQLYQKTTTSPPPSHFTQYYTSGSNSSVKHNHYQPEGASGSKEGASGSKGKSGSSMDRSEGATGGASVVDNQDTNCPICIDTFRNKKQLKCKHEFCEECLEQSKNSIGPMCPVCKDVFGTIEGNQPDGKMTWDTDQSSLPGFSGCGTITIHYHIQSGKQTEKHPKPGEYFSGIYRTAYLPNNKEGKEVVQLLKKAFDQRLIFTVGESRTTGREGQVTWNDIHHKTSRAGGAQCFGYPDPGYLSRVRDELKAKGIK